MVIVLCTIEVMFTKGQCRNNSFWRTKLRIFSQNFILNHSCIRSTWHVLDGTRDLAAVNSELILIY